jgi:nicotinamide-nucleotide amidase
MKRTVLMSESLINLSQQLGQQLQQKKWRVATAESCTGGGVAAAITLTPGSSAWFDCGIVSYSDQIKSKILGVSPSTLQRYGAVSEAVVCEMVQGVLALSGADIAVGISGIAGPSGGTAEKPVGTVWFACGRKGADPKTIIKQFNGDRHQIQRQAVIFALEGLIKVLN